MGWTSHRKISLVVAWLNTVLPVLALIAVLVCWLVLDLPDTTGEAKAFGTTLLVLVFTYLGAWFILSVLLIKGILETRHKLMAPWVYMSCILVFVLAFYMMYDIVWPLITGIAFIVILLQFIGNCLIMGIVVMVLYPVLMHFMKLRSQGEFANKPKSTTGDEI